MRSAVGLMTLLLVFASGTVEAQTWEEHVDRLWDPTNLEDRTTIVHAILAQAPDFEDVYAHLRQGSQYRADVPTGRVQSVRVAPDGTRFPYFVQVPATYDASRRYPVRVFLHGGVSRPAWDEGEVWWTRASRVESEDYIGVFPAAWNQHRWWTHSQLANLRGILEAVRRTYNTDENRVALIGVSDGGSGAFWVAFRDTTPWAAFLPFIGHPAVLQNPRVAANAPIYRTNLTNKPLYIVNGEVDRLYPTRSMDPFVADFESAGVNLVYRRMEGFGHETSWWPDEAARIDAFIADNPRAPHPKRVSWETESVETAGRAHWVRIDVPGYTGRDARFGPVGLLDTGVPGSRIEATRADNTIRVRSEGVARATFLISPDAFDLEEPVAVEWNGVQVFEGPIEQDLDALLDWASRDLDRTMLYAAELTLDAPPLTESRDQPLPALPL